jgi:hypothetical protein
MEERQDVKEWWRRESGDEDDVDSKGMMLNWRPAQEDASMIDNEC